MEIERLLLGQRADGQTLQGCELLQHIVNIKIVQFKVAYFNISIFKYKSCVLLCVETCQYDNIKRTIGNIELSNLSKGSNADKMPGK